MAIDTSVVSIEAISNLLDQIGFRRNQTADGTVYWELPLAPHVMNASGGLQGGLIATLADIAGGAAALETRGPNGGVVTSDLHVRYLRAVTSGAARAVTRIVHSGKRSVVVVVEVRQVPSDEIAALATISFAAVDFATGG